MPYRIRKVKCKRSDGKSGNYVLEYIPKGKSKYKRAGCHTSKKNAAGQRAAIEGGPRESRDRGKLTLKESALRQLIREAILESDILDEKKKRPGLWDNINRKKKEGRKSNPRSKEYQAAKKAGEKLNREADSKKISEALSYHVRSGVGVDRNIFRPGSSAFFHLFRETRKLYNEGRYFPGSSDELELLEDLDIGEFALYEGQMVPLDYPIMKGEEEHLFEAEYKGRKVELNKPKRGGSKGAYVYVKNDKGNVQKVEFGSSMPDAMGSSEEHRKRRKNFGDRHNCAQKKDKTAPGYWSCRLTKFFGRNISGWW